MITMLRACLEAALAEKVFPGYTLAVVTADQVEYISGGSATYNADSFLVDENTLYDVASLTKIVGPMSVAMQLLDEGRLQCADSVAKYIPEYRKGELKPQATIAHLLTYTLDYDIPGGSKALLPRLNSKKICQNVYSYPLKVAPGQTYVYSNLTAFLLTQIIEQVERASFDEVVAKRVFAPLGMKTSTFSPSPTQARAIPPTEITAERGVVQGFVHDEFSHYLRQANISSGAAGLFASVQDLVPFLQMTLGRGVYNGHRICSEEVAKLWIADYWPELLPTHTPLGWGDFNNDLIDRYHRDIVLKGGFTGCFMAADLKQQVGYVLLSNRTYPKRPTDPTAFARLKTDLMDISFHT